MCSSFALVYSFIWLSFRSSFLKIIHSFAEKVRERDPSILFQQNFSYGIVLWYCRRIFTHTRKLEFNNMVSFVSSRFDTSYLYFQQFNISVCCSWKSLEHSFLHWLNGGSSNIGSFFAGVGKKVSIFFPSHLLHINKIHLFFASVGKKNIKSGPNILLLDFCAAGFVSQCTCSEGRKK